jgi:hydrogenase 3 maturation protease
MKNLVMCIGNREGGDDAIGPYIADRLKEKEVEVLDCGVVPENYTSVVKKYNPKNLIIIDAVDMGLLPGETRRVPKEKIGVMHISTHGIPISVLINYLERYVEKIIFIGIQPKSMSGKLNEIVKRNADYLLDIIINKKFDKIEILD